MSDPLLRPDAHDLWAQVRLMAIARDPVLSWEEIAERIGGVPVDELLAWFLSYRLPAKPHVLPPLPVPRNADLKAEMERLRRREESLVTMASEAPRELAIVQRRIEALGKAH